MYRVLRLRVEASRVRRKRWCKVGQKTQEFIGPRVRRGRGVTSEGE